MRLLRIMGVFGRKTNFYGCGFGFGFGDGLCGG